MDGQVTLTNLVYIRENPQIRQMAEIIINSTELFSDTSEKVNVTTHVSTLLLSVSKRG